MAKHSQFDVMIAQLDAEIDELQRRRAWIVEAAGKPKPRREKAAKVKAKDSSATSV